MRARGGVETWIAAPAVRGLTPTVEVGEEGFYLPVHADLPVTEPASHMTYDADAGARKHRYVLFDTYLSPRSRS